MVVKIKPMPYREKYTNMLDRMKFFNRVVPPFVQQHLGEQAVVELQKIWREGYKPIPEEASFEEKYEIAYGNYIRRGESSLLFIRGKLVEEGIEQFNRASVEAFKRINAGPAFFLLRLVRALSPGSAFAMTAK